MTHSNNHPDIVLVYIVKDHHYFPITDEKLKLFASKANRRGVENLLKHISDLKWSRSHENISRLKYVDDMFRLNTENHIILLPEDMLISTKPNFYQPIKYDDIYRP